MYKNNKHNKNENAEIVHISLSEHLKSFYQYFIETDLSFTGYNCEFKPAPEDDTEHMVRLNA